MACSVSETRPVKRGLIKCSGLQCTDIASKLAGEQSTHSETSTSSFSCVNSNEPRGRMLYVSPEVASYARWFWACRHAARPLLGHLVSLAASEAGCLPRDPVKRILIG